MKEIRLHATCLALEGRGVLLRGPSGSGKSDLALRLIEQGARLVADDQTILTREADVLMARAPDNIAGQLEVRGIGIRPVPSLSRTPVDLMVDLVGPGAVERLPEPSSETVLDLPLPRLALDPFAASAPAKLRVALRSLGPAQTPSDTMKRSDAQVVVLVTGLSGAGRSTALHILEDAGFEAMDNLPTRLLERAIRGSDGMRPLAIGMDMRTRDFMAQRFLETLDLLMRDAAISLSLIFLECDDDALIKRFTETRRRHPLAKERPLADGIAAERQMLAPLRERATHHIDTTGLKTVDLARILSGLLDLESGGGLVLHITSFSYRQGLPREADLVFDVRFLRNPHYENGLRHLSGLEPEVAAFVEGDPSFGDFFARLTDLIGPLLPRYEAEGKSYLTIAIGCTGGQHRSVAVAERLAAWLSVQGRAVSVGHRDLPDGRAGMRSVEAKVGKA
ncbi:RNase adapter RapZ [Limibacillus sp. MBR-115]|uniref:RNase adapter RapZ n=1 Tax=Limibacillus sp. MBR-115 TaxID=3156465 RepID=UPI003396872A